MDLSPILYQQLCECSGCSGLLDELGNPFHPHPPIRAKTCLASDARVRRMKATPCDASVTCWFPSRKEAPAARNTRVDTIVLKARRAEPGPSGYWGA